MLHDQREPRNVVETRCPSSRQADFLRTQKVASAGPLPLGL